MPRDEFFADVRRAVSFMAPRVEADSPFTDTNYIQKMLRDSDLWLSRKVVESFNDDDFPDMDEEARAALAQAVDEFRGVAANVNPRGPASLEQRDAALKPFTRIVKIVQDLVRADWVRVSTALLSDAETWAKKQRWPTKRFSKAVTEDFIGNYSLDRLIYSTEGAQLALIPLGRFAPGTDGMFDLAVMPAYDSMMVVRRRDRWFIHPLPGGETQLDWSEDAFVSKSHDLARLP